MVIEHGRYASFRRLQIRLGRVSEFQLLRTILSSPRPLQRRQISMKNHSIGASFLLWPSGRLSILGPSIRHLLSILHPFSLPPDPLQVLFCLRTCSTAQSMQRGIRRNSSRIVPCSRRAHPLCDSWCILWAAGRPLFEVCALNCVVGKSFQLVQFVPLAHSIRIPGFGKRG